MTYRPTQEELNACPDNVLIYLMALEEREHQKHYTSGTGSPNLTGKQKELGRFIASYIQLHEFVPSYQEMADGMDLKSKSGIHRLINGLEERGAIVRVGGHARCIQFVNPQAWGLTQ